MTADHDVAARLALLSLPGIGPARAGWLLGGGPAPEVVDHLRAGRLPPAVGPSPPGVTEALVRRWIAAARAVDGSAVLADTRRAGVEVVGPGHRHWPFADDPEPPVLTFCNGATELLTDRPAVAVVGTRRCTTIGREVAHRFGAELTEAGIVVISGLATGIDGAAHEGALVAGGRPVAVVGTGLDVVYPPRNAGLWRRVATDGVVATEAVLGSRPDRWRFPARNRLIAGLADIVVVVESHAEGGSLLTVGEAADRGVTVMAVPGSVTSPASVGSNQLLVEGCAPACATSDILDVLGLCATRPDRSPAHGGRGELPRRDRSLDAGPGADPCAGRSPLAERILAEAAAGAVHVDRLVEACGVPVPELLSEITALEMAGLVGLEGSTVVRGSGPAPERS